MGKHFSSQQRKTKETINTIPASSGCQTRPFAPLVDTSANVDSLQAKKETKKGLTYDPTRSIAGSTYSLFQLPAVQRQQAAVGLIQAKLTVGAVGDKYEQEADAVATKVVDHLSSPDAEQKQTVQREADDDELQMKPLMPILQRAATQDKEEVQRRSSIPELQQVGATGGTVPGTIEQQIQRARGGGSPLTPRLQRQMGQAMGADFSGVRVHTDSQSDRLNRSIQAKAFTTGKDLFFRKGAYEPESRGGQELIAHELTHVVQQGATQNQMARSPIAHHVQRSDVYIQRDIISDWQNESDVKGTRGRSPELQNIDAFVTGLNQDIQNKDYAKIANAKNTFTPLFRAWQNAKGNDKKSLKSKRRAVLDRLNIAVSEHTTNAIDALRPDRLNGYSLLLDNLIDEINFYKSGLSIGLDIKSGAMDIAKQKVIDAINAVTSSDLLNQDRALIDYQVSAKFLNDLKQAVESYSVDEAIQAVNKLVPNIDSWKVAKAKFMNFLNIHEDMKKYVKANTTDIKLDRFQQEGSATDSISLPRDDRGEISKGGVKTFLAEEAESLDKLKEKAGKNGIKNEANLDSKQVKKLMAENSNEHTGATNYPELENLTNPNNQPTGEVTEAHTLSGVTVNVTHDKSDVNFIGRLKHIESAVGLIQSAGFNLPSFNVYLPKYGRSISLSAPPELKHEVKIGDGIAAAIMHPPNTMAISSEGYNNPKVATGMSVRVDPRGVGTMVHELGHMMHYQNSPSKFTGLNFTFFTGEAPDGRSWNDYIEAAISKYGSSNAREFVAEMFVGLVYKNVKVKDVNPHASKREANATDKHIKKFTRDQALLEMYRDLGGALPG